MLKIAAEMNNFPRREKYKMATVDEMRERLKKDSKTAEQQYAAEGVEPPKRERKKTPWDFANKKSPYTRN